MRFDSVKKIALYYKAIPGMVRLLQQEREDLEKEYDGLHGTDMDGMPRGSSPGKPTEMWGLQCAVDGVGDRLQEIAKKEALLKADAHSIGDCLDTLNGRYKRIIILRYVRGYSWTKVSMTIQAPDSTTRDWHRKAMKRFGEALETVPGVAAMVVRASRART